MSGEELRERLAEALSVVEGEMTTYSPDAHPDHNRWSWRGDGHGDAIRGRYYALADEALAVVLPERDALRAAVEHTHGSLHFCADTREWWTEDPAYDGHHAKRGRCPVLVALEGPA